MSPSTNFRSGTSKAEQVGEIRANQQIADTQSPHLMGVSAALVAKYGLGALTGSLAHKARHISKGRCPQCEEILIKCWGRDDSATVRVLVFDECKSQPHGSAYREALRQWFDHFGVSVEGL